jgi:hypothetical protein
VTHATRQAISLVSLTLSPRNAHARGSAPHIGGESEGVTILVTDSQLAREGSEGWTEADVTVKLGAWSGRYSAAFHESDFKGFASGLRSLYETLSGEAALLSMDGYLDLRLTGDGYGHISVVGEAWDQPRYGTHLAIEFEVD